VNALYLKYLECCHECDFCHQSIQACTCFKHSHDIIAAAVGAAAHLALCCQVALRFKPRDLLPVQLKLTCVFNNTSVNSSTLLLTGCASEPQLSWDVKDSQLFFRPTCVGASSQRVITVTNVSRVPVSWQWLLSKKLQEAVTVQPMVSADGQLAGPSVLLYSMRNNPLCLAVHSAPPAVV
jgi:hypothetical protein